MGCELTELLQLRCLCCSLVTLNSLPLSSNLIVFSLNPKKDLGFPAKDLVSWYWISFLFQEVNPTRVKLTKSKLTEILFWVWLERDEQVNLYLDSTV